MITVDPSGDLVVKVVEFDDSIDIPFGEKRIVLREEEYLVRKQIIYEHSRPLSSLLRLHLRSDNAAETFTIQDDATKSMEIWFRAAHNTLTEASHQVKVDEIWGLTVWLSLPSLGSYA